MRKALGRGLEALLPGGAPAEATGSLVKDQVPLAQIRPSPTQPRRHFDETAL